MRHLGNKMCDHMGPSSQGNPLSLDSGCDSQGLLSLACVSDSVPDYQLGGGE